MDLPLVLRPGVAVLQRGRGVLQVGLDSPVVRLRDAPEVRALLEALGGGGLAPPDVDDLPPAARSGLERLSAAGLLAPALSAGHAPDAALTALRARSEDAARRRLARAVLEVEVVGHPAVLAEHDETLGALLRGAGLGGGAAGAVRPARVRLVLAAGVLDREVSDDLLREGCAHLVLSGSAAGVRLGPLVVPGATACVRCVDAHESLADPRRPLLLAQAARADARRPPPRDVVLDHLALAWAVRDLALLAEGEEPSTWSTTWDLRTTGAPLRTRWGRHPECGCAWDSLEDQVLSPGLTTRRSPAWPPST